MQLNYERPRNVSPKFNIASNMDVELDYVTEDKFQFINGKLDVLS